MKAGSGRRAAASAAILLVVAGCGGAGHERTDSRAALRGVAAHRLADEPSRNRPPQRPAWNGPHPVRMRQLTVARNGLFARWYIPRDITHPMPAVVAFGGSRGGLREGPLAHAFASYGYPALALAYFKAPGLPRQLRGIPLEYFERAIRFVGRQPGVSRVIVCGASRGGEAALLLGATYPRLISGVIGIVPAYQVNFGWTVHGREIPYDTPIRVERIRGPILTASGGRDRVWSSSVYTEQIELRLDDANFRYPHERLNYPTEGHGLSGAQADLWRHIRGFMRRLR